MKEKLKTLLPTLKEKKRYLAFQIISNDEIKDISTISSEIMAKTQELIGQLGIAKAGIEVIKDCYDPKTQKGIIKVGHKSVDEIKLSLSFIEKINNKKVIMKPLGVSGILKKAKERYLRGVK